MDPVKVAFGGLFLVIGVISLLAYITKSEYLFSKKVRMKSFWGDNAGTVMHFTKYVIVPLAFGAALIISQT
jgi:hypothetical protein